MLNEQHNRLISAGLGPGVYAWSRKQNFAFRPRELSMDGVELSKLHLRIEGETEIIRPALNLRFDVSERGRAHMFVPVEQPNGLILQVSIVDARVRSGRNSRGKAEKYLVAARVKQSS